METAPKARRTRLMALAVAGLAVVSMSAGATSLALFTDQETVDATSTAGTILLDATKIDALSLTNTNLVPGDYNTSAVDVENDGTNELAYSLITASTDASSPNGAALYTALTVQVKEKDTDGVGCGSFDGADIVATEVLGATNTLFGDPSPTVNTSDRVVAAAATDTLCIRMGLPIATDNTFQAGSSVTTFTFDAEQTENN